MSSSSSSSLVLDAGLLTVSHVGPVKAANLSTNGTTRDRCISDLVTDGLQHLFQALFALPVEPSEDGRIVNLPPSTTLQLPREKPLPKKRDLTTWQKFAQRKGIRTGGKRDRLQFDEANDDWRPRYGRNRANDADAQQWCVEHKDGEAPSADPWAERKANKKVRVDKNRQQQERNLTGAKGPRLPGTVDLGSATQFSVKGAARSQKAHVAVAYDIAASSTASMGAFDRKVSSLEPAKDKAGTRAKLQARGSAASVRADVRSEKSANLALLSRILGGDKAPKIDKDKAANLHQAKAERKVHRAKKR